LASRCTRILDDQPIRTVDGPWPDRPTADPAQRHRSATCCPGSRLGRPAADPPPTPPQSSSAAVITPRPDRDPTWKGGTSTGAPPLVRPGPRRAQGQREEQSCPAATRSARQGTRARREQEPTPGCSSRPASAGVRPALRGRYGRPFEVARVAGRRPRRYQALAPERSTAASVSPESPVDRSGMLVRPSQQMLNGPDARGTIRRAVAVFGDERRCSPERGRCRPPDDPVDRQPLTRLKALYGGLREWPAKRPSTVRAGPSQQMPNGPTRGAVRRGSRRPPDQADRRPRGVAWPVASAICRASEQ
jgi:hypothetical protein